MSWSKCFVQIAKLANDYAATGKPTAPESLTSVGIIDDKSTTIAAEDGETLTAKASGGIVVAEEHGEQTITITTRVKEPTEELDTLLLGAETNTASKKTYYTTTLVDGEYYVKVTPKNKGAIGTEAFRTQVTYKIGQSEEAGRYADLTFKILPTESGYLYANFRAEAQSKATDDTPATATGGTPS